jgi:hypothetical protein
MTVLLIQRDQFTLNTHPAPSASNGATSSRSRSVKLNREAVVVRFKRPSAKT